MKPFVVLVLALVSVAAAPVATREATPGLPFYTGVEFQALYDYAVANTLPNLDQPDGQGAITGDSEVDNRIWQRAIARGYLLRPRAAGGLATVDGVLMQGAAAEAWQALETEARLNGLSFIVSSAYRSLASQRAHFLSKLNGTSDEAIDAALTWYSVPGTSKHHSGYALDFRYRDGTFATFRDTPDFAWLSADNFAVAKKHGFVPSYPDDGDVQGPNPEPWEFVWVGTDLIRCGIPIDLGQSRFFDAHSGWLSESIATCPGSVTVADLDYMLGKWGRKIEAMLNV